MCKLLYMFTHFQVSERHHQGPEFSHNYLIDYLTIMTSYPQKSKLLLGM